MKEHGDKVSQDERLALERSIGELRDALKGSDMEKIIKTKDEVVKASHKLAEVIYKEAQAKAQGGAAPGPEAGPQSGPEGNGGNGAKKEGDVVDAEIVDEKGKE